MSGHRRRAAFGYAATGVHREIGVAGNKVSMSRRAFHCLALANCICFALPSKALGRPSPTELGEKFFLFFDSGQFDKTTAFFHFPEDYTEQQRKEDARGIVRFLANLSATAGKLHDRRVKALDGEVITIGVGAGDVPYWATHTEFESGVQTNYVVEAQQGPLGISLNWLSVKGSWELRNLVCNIPSDRPGAREFVLQLAKTLIPAS